MRQKRNAKENGRQEIIYSPSCCSSHLLVRSFPIVEYTLLYRLLLFSIAPFFISQSLLTFRIISLINFELKTHLYYLSETHRDKRSLYFAMAKGSSN